MQYIHFPDTILATVGSLDQPSTSDVARASPRKPSRLRLVLWAVVLAVVLFVIAIGIRACTTPSCWDDEKTNTLSPDSRYVAHAAVRYCQGPLSFNLTAAQFAEIAVAGTGQTVRIFESDLGGPPAQVRWMDDRQLGIEFHGKATIKLSLRGANGVRVAYLVPRKLMNTQWSEGMQTRLESAYQAGRVTARDFATLSKANENWRRWEEEFIHWASENATIGE
jgi:hypothetical protein